MLTTCGLVIIVELCSPGTFLNWFDIFVDAEQHVSSNRNAVLLDQIQTFFPTYSVFELWFPIWLTALILLGITLVCLPTFRELDSGLPLAATLSLISAPYGWLHDQAVLGLVQIVIFATILEIETSSARRNIFLTIALSFILFTLIMRLFFDHGQHEFFWLPIGMLILFVVAHCSHLKQ